MSTHELYCLPAYDNLAVVLENHGYSRAPSYQSAYDDLVIVCEIMGSYQRSYLAAYDTLGVIRNITSIHVDSYWGAMTPWRFFLWQISEYSRALILRVDDYLVVVR